MPVSVFQLAAQQRASPKGERGMFAAPFRHVNPCAWLRAPSPCALTAKGEEEDPQEQLWTRLAPCPQPRGSLHRLSLAPGRQGTCRASFYKVSYHEGL